MNLEGLCVVFFFENKKVKLDLLWYFFGGFIVVMYGLKDGGDIDGIQMEFFGKICLRWGENIRNRIVNVILCFYWFNYI